MKILRPSLLPVFLGLVVGACGAVAPAPATGPGPGVPIHAIQGAAPVSPLLGETLAEVRGLVTVATANGFFLEDLPGDRDGDDATSDGIFVYTADPPGVVAGDLVVLRGARVEEYGFGELSSTELTGAEVEVLSSGNPLPDPVPVGWEGRMPPGESMEDGLRFWEGLEGMRITLLAPTCVGPANVYGEIPVVTGGARPRTIHGGLAIGPGDPGPERIFLDDALVPGAPAVKTGDLFAGPVTGVVTYSFGNYKLRNFEPLPPLIDGGARPETTDLVADGERITVATLNAYNLAPKDFAAGRAKGPALARFIVENLRAPDLLALQEVQDESGSRDDGTVSARGTFEALVAAIRAVGGPAYDWLDVPPADGADGGEPGANIRVGFLHRPDRLDLVDGPFRLAPEDPAWSVPEPSRRSLAAGFAFRGRPFLAVNNHFKSRREDDPLWGAVQPPVLRTQAQRTAQGSLVHTFVAEVLAGDPGAPVIVLGDLNDYDFGPAVLALAGGLLENLMGRLPAGDRYTYLYDGTSQCLDHVLVSPALAGAEVDAVHAHADFPGRNPASDHDAVVVGFRLRDR